ncbi:hypothetical protein Btru_076488 [Bulinus truncatus]|nr:hypothetical protein Btru_076488 [Bulinus truncatus]
MTTQVGGKSVNDREMAAVMYNLKEQRVLEKSLQTLELEQSYAIRLLELDNRIVKVKFKKLKEKVSRIKSYLEPDDITELQELELQGKLRPLYGDCSGSAIKIAAATRRLNLSNSRTSSRRTTRSALPRITLDTERKEARSKSAVLAQGTVKRCNSVTGVFTDAPAPNLKRERPVSAFVPQTFHSTPSGPTQRNNNNTEHLREESLNTDVTTKKLNLSVSQNLMHPSGTSLTVRALSASTHSQFSSHVTPDARAGLTTAPANYSRRHSSMSSDSIYSNLGNNFHEERRQELLEEESLRAATLDKRTKRFLQNVDTFLQKNIPLSISPTTTENDPPSRNYVMKSTSNDPYSTGPSVKYHRRRGMGVEFDDTPTYFPESNYKEKLMTLWKDMNKCRYLRVSDDKIDLSGINTLVKDQMKMFDKLKQTDRPPLKEAWE